MNKIVTHKLTELRLVGGRFEQNTGWLDFDVLPELLIYKRILTETAKEEWRRRNPDRKNLPVGFEDKIRLAFHEIRDGSCTIPVERINENMPVVRRLQRSAGEQHDLISKLSGALMRRVFSGTR
jgi:hypothetical protein